MGVFFTIVIDGVDGAGKSTLARYVAWQIGAPLIELDLLINSYKRPLQFDQICLKQLIESRHSQDRPVIIEGIKILETLDSLDIEPDFIILVKKSEYPGKERFKSELQEYFEKYTPCVKANITYDW